MKNNLTARGLRMILFALIVLTTIVAVVGFVFAQRFLSDYAVNVSKKNTSADTGSTNIQSLTRLKTYIAENKAVINKTRDIAAESKEYRYQNQIVTDLNKYAAASGLTIDRFDFTADTPAGDEAAAAEAPAATTATSAVAGSLSSTTATITVQTPALYSDLLTFIKKIEQNKTKMQITNISLTRSTDITVPRGSVDSQGFEIEVYIR